LWTLPFYPDQFIFVRPLVGDLSFEGPIKVFAKPLGKVFGGGFDIRPVGTGAYRHHPFERIVASRPTFLIMNKT
jgi:hypothetical protein